MVEKYTWYWSLAHVCAHVQTHTPSAHINIHIPKNLQKFLITESNAVNITRIITTLATWKKDGASVDFHNHEVRAVPIRLLTCNVIKMHCLTTGLRPWNYQMAEPDEDQEWYASHLPWDLVKGHNHYYHPDENIEIENSALERKFNKILL